MKHDDLVVRAGKWLRSTAGCTVVFEELVTLTSEIPDAIGWKDGTSYMIECKVSRGDFLADQSKRHRKHPESGIGAYRYYLAPAGLIKVEELPDRWGLLEVDSRGRVNLRAGCHPKRYGNERVSFLHTSNHRSEIYMLLSGLRRLQISLGDAEFRRVVHQNRAERLGELFNQCQ